MGFMLGPEPDLSISYFWYPFDSDVNEMNHRLMNEIHGDGEVYLSSTVVNEKFVIRMAILSFRTRKETIDQAVEMVKRCLEKVMKSALKDSTAR